MALREKPAAIAKKTKAAADLGKVMSGQKSV
jgi:hypothetical protein